MASNAASKAASSSASISREEVAHLARLSRLAVTDEEIDMFAGQLGGILQAVARVGEIDTEDVPATSHNVDLVNVLREDVIVPSLDRALALSCAPDPYDNRFRVPQILAEGE